MNKFGQTSGIAVVRKLQTLSNKTLGRGLRIGFVTVEFCTECWLFYYYNQIQKSQNQKNYSQTEQNPYYYDWLYHAIGFLFVGRLIHLIYEQRGKNINYIVISVFTLVLVDLVIMCEIQYSGIYQAIFQKQEIRNSLSQFDLKYPEQIKANLSSYSLEKNKQNSLLIQTIQIIKIIKIVIISLQMYSLYLCQKIKMQIPIGQEKNVKYEIYKEQLISKKLKKNEKSNEQKKRKKKTATQATKECNSEISKGKKQQQQQKQQQLQTQQQQKQDYLEQEQQKQQQQVKYQSEMNQIHEKIIQQQQQQDIIKKEEQDSQRPQQKPKKENPSQQLIQQQNKKQRKPKYEKSQKILQIEIIRQKSQTYKIQEDQSTLEKQKKAPKNPKKDQNLFSSTIISEPPVSKQVKQEKFSQWYSSNSSSTQEETTVLSTSDNNEFSSEKCVHNISSYSNHADDDQMIGQSIITDSESVEIPHSIFKDCSVELEKSVLGEFHVSVCIWNTQINIEFTDFNDFDQLFDKQAQLVDQFSSNMCKIMYVQNILDSQQYPQHKLYFQEKLFNYFDIHSEIENQVLQEIQ